MDYSSDIETKIVCEPDFNYEGRYSYADYLTWTLDERLELINGKIFRFNGTPNTNHQEVVRNIMSELYSSCYKNEWHLYHAPFDVRFPEKSIKNEDVFTVLQPDLCMFKGMSRLDEAGGIGAPDITIEILAPNNNIKELKNKYQVYETNAVKEYWIFSPQNKTFLAYLLNKEGKYIPTRLMVEGDIYTTELLPGLELNLEEVFDITDFGN